MSFVELKDYQIKSRRTIDLSRPDNENLINFCMGLAGEAGETIDLLKKHLFHCHVLDREDLTKELGDILWYVSGIATVAGIDMDTVASTNISKLLKRYPRGFDPVASRERVE
jgi:NTP pyrophosphatase (non-canonical NTP hydrolase)